MVPAGWLAAISARHSFALRLNHVHGVLRPPLMVEDLLLHPKRSTTRIRRLAAAQQVNAPAATCPAVAATALAGARPPQARPGTQLHFRGTRLCFYKELTTFYFMYKDLIALYLVYKDLIGFPFLYSCVFV
jgi:hypothetical protein